MTPIFFARKSPILIFRSVSQLSEGDGDFYSWPPSDHFKGGIHEKLISLFLALVTILGILPTAAFAASSEEEALGEVDIYNGDYELGYLSINGAVRKQKYTYFCTNPMMELKRNLLRTASTRTSTAYPRP